MGQPVIGPSLDTDTKGEMKEIHRRVNESRITLEKESTNPVWKQYQIDQYNNKMW